MRPRHLLPLALAACATGAPRPSPSSPSVAEAPKTKPKIGSFGVDLDGRDAAVPPGTDFYRFAGGSWMKSQTIPPDRSRWGMFDELRQESEKNVRSILEGSEALTGDAKKARDFYNAYLDVAAIDKRGFAPVEPVLKEIAAIKTHAELARFLGRPDLPLPSPIDAGIGLDDKNPDRYIVEISHGGLGLPDRDFYRKSDKQFVEIRSKYEAHIAKVLGMVNDAQAAAHAKAILALETAIAERHWPIAERRERDKTYNPRTVEALVKEAPEFPWQPYFSSAGLGGVKEVVVREHSAIAPLAKQFAATPVADWKAYLSYHLLRRQAAILPKQLDDEVFGFYGKTLDGQPQQRDRWKRAVGAVDRSLGEAVGQAYVARFFKPKAQTEMAKLIENLRRAYAARIESLEWMTPATKKAALEKLGAFRAKIGYPVKWKDYSALEISADDAYGNQRRAALWDHQRDLERLTKVSDRDEWFMNPQTVNAYYNAAFNEIVFPAAILQPPFFDADADPAVNYGGIGGVIGHEMGHGFDDQGAKSDARGILRTWWGPADVAAFKQRTDKLAEQYAGFEPLPGLKVDGRLTLGENIGDLGGLTVAHTAYLLSLGGKEPPRLDGTTGEQRFFLGWAQVWRTLFRDEALRNQVMSDPHSPAQYRVNGVVRNIDAWYSAFDIKPTDPLFVPPAERVRIW